MKSEIETLRLTLIKRVESLGIKSQNIIKRNKINRHTMVTDLKTVDSKDINYPQIDLQI